MSGSANGSSSNANGSANGGNNSGNSKGGGEIAFGTFLGLAALWEVTRRKKSAVRPF
jgi:hypothetical protein